MSLVILTVSLVLDLIELTVDYPPSSYKSPIVKPFHSETFPPSSIADQVRSMKIQK